MLGRTPMLRRRLLKKTMVSWRRGLAFITYQFIQLSKYLQLDPAEAAVQYVFGVYHGEQNFHSSLGYSIVT
jgi:hypothetical protein